MIFALQQQQVTMVLSIQSGVVPAQMKVARVFPVYKLGYCDQFTNYRPVSVIPISSNLLEKVVGNHLFKNLNDKDISFEGQFGFQRY